MYTHLLLHNLKRKRNLVNVLCHNDNIMPTRPGQDVFSQRHPIRKQTPIDAEKPRGGSVCPYALSPDSTELQAGDVSRVGVGRQNGGSSSYHMPVHQRAADCKAVAAKSPRQRDPKRPTRFIFIFYGAALFVMDTITEEYTEQSISIPIA